ncbi:MAG: LysE family transporter [Planctomycetota bacterium]|nr:LysE family transporter [Planctomycetota bacterium]
MWMFVLYSVGASLSGVMSPGAMTAGVIAAGVRRPWAGLAMALGHAVIELPLMVAIILFAGEFLASPGARIVIGVVGGGMLLTLAGMEFHSMRKARTAEPPPPRMGPFLSGIVLSAGNPFFVAWWATTGLLLTTQVAREYGAIAFGLFALIHWLCDLVWLLLLSSASHFGSGLAGPRWQRGIQGVCAVAMVYFGCVFLYKTALLWTGG